MSNPQSQNRIKSCRVKLQRSERQMPTPHHVGHPEVFVQIIERIPPSDPYDEDAYLGAPVKIISPDPRALHVLDAWKVHSLIAGVCGVPRGDVVWADANEKLYSASYLDYLQLNYLDLNNEDNQRA